MRNRRNKRNFDNSLTFYLKIISNLLVILIIIALALFIYSSLNVKKTALNRNRPDFSNTNFSKSENSTINVPSEVDSETSNTLGNLTIDNAQHTTEKKSTTINMAFTGDIICGNSIYKDAYNAESNTYNFSYIFDNIKFNIQTADIAIGSLETDFSSSNNYNKAINSNSPESLAYSFKKIGFDVLSTATNHSLDKGYSGLEKTIDILDTADISHTGTFKSKESQNTILLKNVKGLKIAFLSFSYGTNGISIPSDNNYCINILSEHQIEKQLALAKTEDPDLICVNVHWGTRYQTKQNAEQEKWADLLFQKGADIIIGNHPHILQSVEKKEISMPDGSTKQGLIAYSIGNFIADSTTNNTKSSIILNLRITKDQNNKINFDKVTYIPIFIFKDAYKTSQKYSILNLNKTISDYENGIDTTCGSKNYTLFKNELLKIKKIFGE